MYQVPIVAVRDQGTMAPSAIERLRFGMTIAGSSSIFTPRPVHSRQAPCGLLNEKLRGSSSPKERPSKTQAKCSEYMRSSSFSLAFASAISSSTIVPPPSRSAVSTESDSRVRRESSSPSPGSALTTRSTTMSMAWRLFLSSLISSSSSRTVPSTRTRTKPALRASSKTLVYSPLRSVTTGARIIIRRPAGTARIESTICCTVCRSIERPHFGQCGWPTRAQSSRM